MKATKIEVPDTKIGNLAELQELIKRLDIKSEDNQAPTNIIIDSVGTPLSDKEFKGTVTVPQVDKESMVKKTLMDGFDVVKKHQEFFKNAKVRVEDIQLFGGYLPATPDEENSVMWIDQFIQKKLGGKRNGLIIMWNLPEGQFKLDPWTWKLEKC